MKIKSKTIHSLEVDGRELELTHRPSEGSVITAEKDGKLTVGYLVQDDDCGNPLEDCDGIGAIKSLSRRHRNHIDREEAEQILSDDLDAVALSYFEHGLCKWDVEGSMGGMPDFQWDGVSFAGVWIPDTCVRESYTGQDGKTRREWMIEQAASACKEYTSWCNGDCWGVCVDVFDAKTGDKLSDDACWGYVGSEWAEQELKSQVENS